MQAYRMGHCGHNETVDEIISENIVASSSLGGGISVTSGSKNYIYYNLNSPFDGPRDINDDNLYGIDFKSFEEAFAYLSASDGRTSNYRDMDLLQYEYILVLDYHDTYDGVDISGAYHVENYGYHFNIKSFIWGPINKLIPCCNSKDENA